MPLPETRKIHLLVSANKNHDQLISTDIVILGRYSRRQVQGTVHDGSPLERIAYATAAEATLKQYTGSGWKNRGRDKWVLEQYPEIPNGNAYSWVHDPNFWTK